MIDPQQPRRDSVRIFAAGGLIAIGGLIFALCGLCTFAFSAQAVLSAIRYPDGVASLVLAIGSFLLIGGVPALGGFLLMRAGLRRLRPPQRKSGPAEFD